MKKALFTLAFACAILLANTSNAENTVEKSNAVATVEQLATTGSIDATVASSAETVSLMWEDCTISFEFEMTDSKGNKYTITGTVTFKGKSCAQLFKEVQELAN